MAASAPATWTIHIRDLVVRARIGVHAREFDHPQPVRVSLALSVVNPLQPIEDRLERVVDYEDVVVRVRAACGQGHVGLVETLCERLAALCLRDPRVRSAKVRVEKLSAFPDVGSVGVEMERLNSQPPPSASVGP